MMLQFPKIIFTAFILLPLSLFSPVSHSDDSEPIQTSDETGTYKVLSSTSLNSDGVEGESAYHLIQEAFGFNSIEAPDLYGKVNHQGSPHIQEGSDAIVGNYFIFLIHRDLDKDRDKINKTDRQRNEIKVYGGSENAVKGIKNTTFEYSWKFKLGDNLAVTKKFTHLFQLKAVGKGEVNTPLLTITANTKNSTPGLEIRHSDYQADGKKTSKHTLAHTGSMGISWESLRGKWIEAFVRANYSEHGRLYLTLKILGEDAPFIKIYQPDIEMWRAGSSSGYSNFIRPKWGIYRSLIKANELNEQDEVDFADFKIQEVSPVISN